MAKQQNTNQAAPAPTLDDLLKAAKELEAKALELQAEAEKEDATDEVKAAAEKAIADATAAAAAYSKAFDAEEAAKAKEAPAEPEAAAQEEEDDNLYVPVLHDEEGKRIPRNRLIRLVTTTGRNLRSLDGELITPEPTMVLKGPDVRKGDWYTVQFQAGLLAVDSTKLLK